MPDVPKLPTTVLVIEDGVFYGGASYRPGEPLFIVDANDPASVRGGVRIERPRRRVRRRPKPPI